MFQFLSIKKFRQSGIYKNTFINRFSKFIEMSKEFISISFRIIFDYIYILAIGNIGFNKSFKLIKLFFNILIFKFSLNILFLNIYLFHHILQAQQKNPYYLYIFLIYSLSNRCLNPKLAKFYQ